MYKAMFAAAYYGLLRAGEVASGPHALKAKDVYVGKNKNEFLFILWTSKTHGYDNKPQMIKITSTKRSHQTQSSAFCPYKLLRDYSRIRPDSLSDTSDEQFFVFRDRTLVTPDMMRKVLKTALKKLNFKEDLFNLHSLRIGRCEDLYDLGLSVETIKKIGRWKSNAVFAYLRS